MPATTFLRLLADDDKAAAMRIAAAAIRNGSAAPDVYIVDPASFRQVPGSPFAYWVDEKVRRMFTEMLPFEGNGRAVRQGMATSDDFRFVRAWWEVRSSSILGGAAKEPSQALRHKTFVGKTWVPFAKGGLYSPYYSDVQLLVNWGEDGKEIKHWTVNNPRDPHTTHWSRNIRSTQYHFLPALTWPLRARKFAPQYLPAGAICSIRGYGIFADPNVLSSIAALGNSQSFDYLFKVLLGRFAFPEFVVGVLQQMPFPTLSEADAQSLAVLAGEAHDLKRDVDRDDEVTHPFTLPALVRMREQLSLSTAIEALRAEDDIRERRIDALQREIDDRCFTLYGFSNEDRAQIEGSTRLGAISAEAEASRDETGLAQDVDDEADGDDETSSKNGKQNTGEQRLRIETANMLMYALGCAFGRWDVRIGRDPSLAPKLADPFAPLPVCAPGALVRPDGLPATKEHIASEAWLRARPDVITLPEPSQLEDAAATTIPAEGHPLPVAWDGILVDDANAPDDIVRRVRAVLDFLWGERADAIESEACAILGVRELRDYFRNPRLFFDFHIGRYSKSRRKAPIYWLLQSPKRNYAIWLYYHRLDADLIFKAINFHLLPKIRLEEQRLEELDAARKAAGTTGGEARRAAQAVDRQEALLADLREFHAALDRAARLYLTPDLNDGVILNIAPYWEVVPWKEAKATWGQLISGKYGWSSIGKQLREKGQVAVK